MKKHIPLIFTIFAFIVMMALGTWQVYRLQWKTELINKIDTRLNEAPIALKDFKNADEDEYRLITVKGTFDYGHEMIVIGRPYNGKPGVHVITPMETEGKTLIINRGWAKYDEPYSKPAGEVEVTGIIRKNTERNWLNRHVTMDNEPEKNMWFYVDLPQMYQHISKPAEGFYIEEVGDIKPNSYPYALEKKINLYNEHLSYVITWYSLAVALLLVYYFRFHRKSKV